MIDVYNYKNLVFLSEISVGTLQFNHSPTGRAMQTAPGKAGYYI